MAAAAANRVLCSRGTERFGAPLARADPVFPLPRSHHLSILHSGSTIHLVHRPAISPSLLQLEAMTGGEPESTARAYEEALSCLSSLITRRTRAHGANKGDRFDLMFEYLKVLELDEPVSRLKVIHVAGTKGKGSTCVFTESILRSCGFHTGLFTSPHLIDVREVPIGWDGCVRGEISGILWWCWDTLQERATDNMPMPTYFRFLALLAFKIFVEEQVDVAILEVGLGGKFDATNVVQAPILCGISSLGYDHMEILGNTLGEIAGEKAGIFKPGVPAYTVPQPEEAMTVLQAKASQLGISLHVALPLDRGLLNGQQLGLDGEHQYMNAGLAIAIVRSWLQKTGNDKGIFAENASDLPDQFLRGLSSASLQGRAQIVPDPYFITQGPNFSPGGLVFYLDGAHSPESMIMSARWFSHAVKENIDHVILSGENINNSCSDRQNQVRILVFNCMSVRDPQNLLPPLINTCSDQGVTDHTVVTVNEACKVGEVINARSFENSAVFTSIPSVIKWLRECAQENRTMRIQYSIKRLMWIIPLFSGVRVRVRGRVCVPTSEVVAAGRRYHGFWLDEIRQKRAAERIIKTSSGSDLESLNQQGMLRSGSGDRVTENQNQVYSFAMPIENESKTSGEKEDSTLPSLRKALKDVSIEKDAAIVAKEDALSQLRTAKRRLKEAEEEQYKAEEDAAALRAELNSMHQQIMTNSYSSTPSIDSSADRILSVEKEIAYLKSELQQSSLLRQQEQHKLAEEQLRTSSLMAVRQDLEDRLAALSKKVSDGGAKSDVAKSDVASPKAFSLHDKEKFEKQLHDMALMVERLESSRQKLLTEIDSQSSEIERLFEENSNLSVSYQDALGLSMQWENQVKECLKQNEQLRHHLDKVRSELLNSNQSSNSSAQSQVEIEKIVAVAQVPQQLITENQLLKDQISKEQSRSEALSAEILKLSSELKQASHAYNNLTRL
ncbi:hypothetical protein HPP92_018172 [Vanilla planifolia]|uniref:tetrahydrofolate synthase n=1 Tax=Vanilla planifolia TaxID=51239 RepID=A0A835QCA8_VANPL|nr:hypothetical protein HPP92_018172 [Vanilla planifolia]